MENKQSQNLGNIPAWKKRYGNYFNLFLTLFIIIAVPKIYSAYIKAEQDKDIKESVEEYKKHYAEYDRLIQNSKSNWKLGNYEETVKQADEALKIANTDDEKSTAHYWRGIGLYRLNKMDEAKIEEETAIKLYPSLVGPYITLGAIYNDRKDYEKAIELAKKVISIDQSYPWAYNLLGLAFINQGKIDEGIAEIEKAAKLDPVTFQPQLDWARSQAR